MLIILHNSLSNKDGEKQPVDVPLGLQAYLSTLKAGAQLSSVPGNWTLIDRLRDQNDNKVTRSL